jgi:hypothetical protein
LQEENALFAVEMDAASCDIALFTERLNLSGFRTDDPKLGGEDRHKNLFGFEFKNRSRRRRQNCRNIYWRTKEHRLISLQNGAVGKPYKEQMLCLLEQNAV